jgi:hypothetical protein
MIAIRGALPSFAAGDRPERGPHIKTRQLVAGASFAPGLVKVLFGAFDDAGKEIGIAFAFSSDFFFTVNRAASAGLSYRVMNDQEPSFVAVAKRVSESAGPDSTRNRKAEEMLTMTARYFDARFAGMSRAS